MSVETRQRRLDDGHHHRYGDGDSSGVARRCRARAETKAGTTVLVTLNDNLIAVENPDDIPPGPSVLTVKNIGTQVHNLYIEGPGMDKAASDSFAPGKVVDVNVDFQPGTYTFYCPILDHRKKGEELKLVIKPPKAPAPSSITG